MTDVPPTTPPPAPNGAPASEPPKTTDKTEPSKTSSWGIAILTAVFGLLGVVVGGFLQYLYSGLLETEKQRMQIELSAYADFAKAQAAWQRAGAEKDQSKREAAENDAALKIRDAAFRIVVFSPPEVVGALSAFVAQSGNREECNLTKGDIALYQTIRQQNSGQNLDSISNFIRRQLRGRVSESDNVSNEDIAMGLFGCKLQTSR